MRIATNTMEVATLKIFCPAVIGFAASLVEEMKEMKEIFIPLGEAISALSAISVGLLASHADSFYCPTEIKEIKEILLPARCEAISAISAISVGLLLSHAESVLLSRFLLSRRNKGNSRNYSYSPPRSSFCSFSVTLLSHADSIFIVPRK